MIIHEPDNSFVIKEIWAFCSKDEGGEGIIGIHGMPMVGADMDRIDSYRPIVEKIATKTKKRIVLKKFKLVGTEEIVK